MKIPIFILTRTIKSWVKWMLDSQRTFKIKIRLRWTVFEILLTSAIISFKKFWMETRLSNIIQTTNVTNFSKASLKSCNGSISYIHIENTKTTGQLFKGSWILLYFLTFKLTKLWLCFGESCKATHFKKPTEVSQNTLTPISIGPPITK